MENGETLLGSKYKSTVPTRRFVKTYWAKVVATISGLVIQLAASTPHPSINFRLAWQGKIYFVLRLLKPFLL